MKTASLFTAATVSALLAACSPAGSATKSGGEANVVPPTAAPVVLEARPDLQADAQALPRLVGDSPAIVAINADLDRLDHNAVTEGCSLERTVTQPMNGPEFLTFAIAESTYCEGAAHPNHSQMAVTYDLASGNRVDWATAIPGLALTTDEAMTELPEGWIYLNRSPALAQWYVAHALAQPDIGDCREVFNMQTFADNGFYLSASAMTGGVTVQPELPFVVAACAAPMTITAEDLRGFNADARLLDAIATAHDAGNFVAD